MSAQEANKVAAADVSIDEVTKVDSGVITAGSSAKSMTATSSMKNAMMRARNLNSEKKEEPPKADDDNSETNSIAPPADAEASAAAPKPKPAKGKGKGTGKRTSLALAGNLLVEEDKGKKGAKRASLAIAPQEAKPMRSSIVGDIGAAMHKVNRQSIVDITAAAASSVFVGHGASGVPREDHETQELKDAEVEQEERELGENWDPRDTELDELATHKATLTFKNVGFSVQVTDPDDVFGKRKIDKPILENAWGHWEPGNLVALMGPSGCGKSTLMDILARKKTTKYTGEVFMNGRPLDNMYERITSYVSQEDIMPPHWTVEEAVAFDATLKKPRNKGMAQASFDMLINTVLEDVGLLHVKTTKVGNAAVRGISGGQRRRVTLARGIVARAALMFCDEPTSGLSATDAELCVKTLVTITRRWNATILVVIHQPRVEIAELFDHLLLLTSRPGRIVYNGKMSDAAAHWGKVGFAVPAASNPTDFFLDTVSPGLEGADPDKFVGYYNNTVLPQVKNDVEEAIKTPGRSAMDLLIDERNMWLQFGALPMIDNKPTGTSWMTQFRALFHRKLTLTFKDPAMIAIIFVVKIMMGVIYGIIMQDVGSKEPKGVAQVPFFFTVLQQVTLQAMNVMPVLFEERHIMKLETMNAVYSTSAYVAATSIVDLVLSAVSTVPLLLIINAFAAMPWDMVHELLVWCIITSLAMEAILLTVGAAAKDMMTAQSAVGPVVVIPLLFSGLLVSRKSCPDYLKWMLDLSPLNYVTEYLTYRFYGQGCEDIADQVAIGKQKLANHQGICYQLVAMNEVKSDCLAYCNIYDMFEHAQPTMTAVIVVLAITFVLFRGLHGICLSKLNKIQK